MAMLPTSQLEEAVQGQAPQPQQTVAPVRVGPTKEQIEKAAQLRAQGVRPGKPSAPQQAPVTNPNQLRIPQEILQAAQLVDPTNDVYYGRGIEVGDGWQTLGNNQGDYSGIPAQFAAVKDNRGNYSKSVDQEGFKKYLEEQGLELRRWSDGQTQYVWTQKPDGTVVGKVDANSLNDGAFGLMSNLMANMVVGAIGGPGAVAAWNASQGAAQTAQAGGNLGDILKGAAVSGGTSYLGNSAANGLGLSGAAAGATSNAISSGANTAIAGGNLQDVLKSAVIGGATGAVSSGLKGNPAQSAIAGLVRGALSGKSINNRQLVTQLLVGLLRQQVPKKG